MGRDGFEATTGKHPGYFAIWSERAEETTPMSQTSSDDYLRKVAAAAIRLVKLEEADHKLLNDFKPGEVSNNNGGSPRIKRHQQLWDRIRNAKRDLIASVSGP